MNFDEKILVISNGVEKLLAIALLWSSIIIFVLMLVLTVANLFGKKFKPEYKSLFIMNFFMIFGSYIVFVFKYPQVCSMNFRYIVNVLILLMVNGAYFTGISKSKVLRYSFCSLIVVESALSTILYLIAAV